MESLEDIIALSQLAPLRRPAASHGVLAIYALCESVQEVTLFLSSFFFSLPLCQKFIWVINGRRGFPHSRDIYLSNIIF